MSKQQMLVTTRRLERRGEVGAREVQVEVWVDWDAIVKALAYKAFANKSRRTRVLHGAVEVRTT